MKRLIVYNKLKKLLNKVFDIDGGQILGGFELIKDNKVVEQNYKEITKEGLKLLGLVLASWNNGKIYPTENNIYIDNRTDECEELIYPYIEETDYLPLFFITHFQLGTGTKPFSPYDTDLDKPLGEEYMKFIVYPPEKPYIFTNFNSSPRSVKIQWGRYFEIKKYLEITECGAYSRVRYFNTETQEEDYRLILVDRAVFPPIKVYANQYLILHYNLIIQVP